MLHEMKRILLTAATLCAAGCATSDYQLARQDRANMRSVSASDRANAKDEKPPKILPDTHFAAGMLFEQQGQFDKALHQYRKAVALNHNFVAAYHRLGLLQSAVGQHLEAAESLQRAVALRPENAVLHNDLGFEWMRVQRWDDAESELRRAIELQPDLATAHINLALVQAKSERFGESLASFQTVLPEADAYYNLGLMYRAQQRYGEAIAAFRHVLTIAPEFSAAQTQLEKLNSRTEGATPVEAKVEAPLPGRANERTSFAAAKTAPPFELFAILADVTAPEPAPPTTPEYAVESNQKWGTTLADLAAILAVLDANATHDSADGPCDEEVMMPSAVAPTDETVVFVETDDDERSIVDEFNEAPQVLVANMEEMGPPVPCDPEIEEVDADDVIAGLSAAPITQPMSLGDSWAMLDELEAKVALLRFETQAFRTEKAGFSDWTLWHEVLMTPPTWIEPGMSTIHIDTDSTTADFDEFDDLEAPFVELDEEDAESDEPTVPSRAVKEVPRKDPAPSSQSSLWTTQFGELHALLSIVQNETVCLEDLDARTRDILASNEEDPCVESAEQEASIEPQEFSPATFSESEESMSVMGPEPAAGLSSDRSGNVFATYQRGLEPLPD